MQKIFINNYFVELIIVVQVNLKSHRALRFLLKTTPNEIQDLGKFTHRGIQLLQACSEQNTLLMYLDTVF